MEEAIKILVTSIILIYVLGAAVSMIVLTIVTYVIYGKKDTQATQLIAETSLASWLGLYLAIRTIRKEIRESRNKKGESNNSP